MKNFDLKDYNLKFINDSNKLFYLIEENGNWVRCYDRSKVDMFDMFYSETKIRFEILQLMGYSFYIVYNNSKRNVLLNEEDIKYLSIDLDFSEIVCKRLDEPLDFKHTKNISFLKEQKYNDLNYFHLIPEIRFIYILLKKTVDNYFYYDLILGVKGGRLDENILKNFDSELISVEKTIPLNQIECDINFIKSFFNLENTVFKDIYLTHAEGTLYSNWDEVENSIEWIEYNSFIKKMNATRDYKIVSNEENMALRKYLEERYREKERQKVDLFLYKKFIFKKLCSAIFFYDQHYDCYFDSAANMHYVLPEFQTFTSFYESKNVKDIEVIEGGTIMKIQCTGYFYDDLISCNCEKFVLEYIPMNKNS